MFRPLDSMSYSKFDLIYYTYSEKPSISISNIIFLFLPFLRLKWLLKFTCMASRSLYFFSLSVLILIYFTIHSNFPSISLIKIITFYISSIPKVKELQKFTFEPILCSNLMCIWAFWLRPKSFSIFYYTSYFSSHN